MIILKNAHDLSQFLEKNPTDIHFVPTMGALHEGHLSLIQEARKGQGICLCSIFVNPTQFNNASDLLHYPRTIDKDIELLLSAGCDVLFLPDVKEMYPNGTDYQLDVNITVHQQSLEGAFRPGHFEGVVQVLDRFIQLVRPHTIYMGEKDLQQIQVVRNLVKQKYPQVTIHPCPTLRDSDGLAKSSRNQRLTVEQRAIAPLIYQNLRLIIDNRHKSDFLSLKAQATHNLTAAGFKIDYLELMDLESWQKLDSFSDNKMALLIAAYLGEIRLIDNILF